MASGPGSNGSKRPGPTAPAGGHTDRQASGPLEQGHPTHVPLTPHDPCWRVRKEQPLQARLELLCDRLQDERSGKVLVLSHCLLNQNVRYLGGAVHPGMG
jgi:hypothetical protein